MYIWHRLTGNQWISDARITVITVAVSVKFDMTFVRQPRTNQQSNSRSPSDRKSDNKIKKFLCGAALK